MEGHKQRPSAHRRGATKSFKLSADEAQALERAATAAGVSYSELIRLALHPVLRAMGAATAPGREGGPLS